VLGVTGDRELEPFAEVGPLREQAIEAVIGPA
jgi:hypothetical protein